MMKLIVSSFPFKQFMVGIACVFYSTICSAQDSLYARSVINTLTSNSYYGRGYVKQGDAKAAQFIADEFKRWKLVPLTDNYFQPFSFPVNTFPSRMKVCVDDKALIPGRDYIVHPSSASARGTYKIFIADKPPAAYTTEQVQNKFVLVRKPDGIDAEEKTKYAAWNLNPLGAKGILFAESNKLTWSVSSTVFKHPDVYVLKASLPENPKKVKLNISNKLIAHTAQNVIAELKGKQVPDSFIVITAHLDHLGMMGNKTIFPGANDNASGISMLLNLAKAYAQNNSSKYSLLFIAFAGEEIGLLGSKYYTEHPLVPLEKINFC